MGGDIWATRRWKFQYFGSIALLFIALLFASWWIDGWNLIARPAISASAPVPEGWECRYRARVVRVVDADTIDLAVSLGFEIDMLMRVRLAGLDAPELRTEAGKAAKAKVEGLLPVDLSVVLQTDADKRDKFGRLLGVVLLSDGLVVNDYLLESGLAKPYDGGAK